MNSKERKALVELLEYVEDDERKDYFNRIEDEPDINHIYQSICILSDMVWGKEDEDA